MNAVPAKVAGVPRVVMVAPTPRGDTNPLVLAAAKLAGVDEVYRIGGAQAIAALAYGTATIAPRRQDRRTRQRLCGGGQAPGVRRGRHRHDRRPVRGADPRRREREPRLDRRRSPRPGRARRRGAVDPRSPTAPALADAVEEAVDGQLADPAARATSPARAGAISAPSSWCRASPTRSRSSTASRRSISRSRPATPTRSPPSVRNAGAIFLGATRRRRSATMSAARTTSCRRRARPGSPPASACSTS